MPQNNPSTAGGAVGSQQSSVEAVGSGEPAGSVLHPSASPLMLWSIGVIVVLASAATFYYIRSAAHRAWRRYALEIGGEFSERNRLAPAYVSGSLLDRAIFMEASTNNDDDAPYYHTRASMPVTNPGMLIMGLRRKSLLEEAQTRNDKPVFEFGDSDFDRRFHLISNDMSALPNVLDQGLRRLLIQYNDIEVYIRADVVEWRRSGELADLQAIRRLNNALSSVAASIDALPRRSLALSDRLSYEELIRKGI